MRSFLRFAVIILVLPLIASGCISSGPQSSDKAASSSESTVNASESPQNIIDRIPVRTVRVDDIEIAYKEFGAGEPLIFITGYKSTMDLWPPEVLLNLSSKYHVIIFDNRGMGLTTSSDKPFSLELFADDTAGLIDALNISRANVLGWSMGADISQELAIRHPDKVGRLILYAGSIGGSEGIEPEPDVMRKLTDNSGTAAEQGERLLSLLFPADWLSEHPNTMTYFPIPKETSTTESYERQTEAMASWNGTYSRLSEIKSPTLLLTGAEDVLTPPANSFVLGEKIPGAWIIQVQNSGHGLMYQYPEKFERIIAFFLDERNYEK
ncbi:MAG: alpha/beta hydrolase [Methanomicrobiaceae archaeon]|nr:alpha/beta hydrolase [Methanomicrobiaceae archaeon]